MVEACPDCDQPMLPAGQLKRPNEYDHASGCPRDVKLTKPQREELERLARERQNTFGKGRARVQNTLKRLGLAIFLHGDADSCDECMITPAGRALLVSSDHQEKKT